MKPSDVLDAALEASLVLSFARPGFVLRRWAERWAPSAFDLRGRVFVLTGATSGIGRCTADMLVSRGATLEIVARDRTRAERVCAALRSAYPGAKVDFVVADTGDLDAMRQAAATLNARHASVSGVLHNAGALDDVRSTTPQGLEQTVASHVVGPFLLTALLLPSLRAGSGKVVFVSSGGMYSENLDVDALEMGPRDYDGVVAYARAKRAQVTLVQCLASHVPDLEVHSLHPGWADTPGVARSLPRFRALLGPMLRTPEQAADTLVWLAASRALPDAPRGSFWHDRRPRPLHRLARTARSDTPQERDRLWAWALSRSGLPSEWPQDHFS